MITFLLWLWRSDGVYYQYTPARAEAMAQMIADHYEGPHRVLVLTDNPLTPYLRARPVPLLKLWRDVPVAKNMPPHSWTRLQVFHPEYASYLADCTGLPIRNGDPVVNIDLDGVIVDDITPLFRDLPRFKGWLSRGYRAKPCIYNASMFALRLGECSEVYRLFDPKISPAALKHGGYIGTEQAHMSAVLGAAQPAWTWKEGVCSYRFQVARAKKPDALFTGNGSLPDGAKIVFMHGSLKPWTCNDSWCLDNYPDYAR